MKSLQELCTPKYAVNWQIFVKQEQLDEHQSTQFACYLALLREWNEKINLTRIVDVASIISLHFQDSLRIKNFIDFKTIRGVVDVGTGAGFPGIPLKIMFPELPIVLLEVNEKKVAFLETVIKELNLENIQVCTLDFRTFLRQTSYNANLFCARASLKPEELVRIFKPSSPYKDATLVYWASKQWQPTEMEKKYIVKREAYTLDSQERVYVFFRNQYPI